MVTPSVVHCSPWRPFILLNYNIQKYISLIDGFCFVAGKVHSISSIMPSQITESGKVHKAVNEIDKFR